MIRINLLPVREARRAANMRKQGVLLGAAAGAGVVVCLCLSMWMTARISLERTMIAAKEGELKKLEVAQKEVKKFQQEQADIEQKLGVIDQIEAARLGPVKIMDELATRVPNRVWLTALSAKSGVIQISGRSIDAEVVADLTAALEESPMFSGVDLQESTLEEADGLKLAAFKLSAQYPYVKAVEVAKDKRPKRGGGAAHGKPVAGQE